ncbi:hypothetical protein [Hydrocarboniclastica marina]|uniref:hypothetical protein n=1 Tax=Hydrocarboniclastica marina TaxID=2259620 RepID=UPI0010A8B23F|nr:hypothetical protein [Hydrocarboniclastica marina]
MASEKFRHSKEAMFIADPTVLLFVKSECITPAGINVEIIAMFRLIFWMLSIASTSPFSSFNPWIDGHSMSVS